MRILYLDIDALRADHLGCYGYLRSTSPNIDRIAAGGVRLDKCYVSDAPCLPSRASMFLGQFGIHNGIVNHGGACADARPLGAHRHFNTHGQWPGFIERLARHGVYPVSISPFPERHSAWWFYAGWREMVNTGKGGMEGADDVLPAALDWIARNARGDNWLLHVNLWDPHTPYRAPASFGEPFVDAPMETWYTEEIRRAQWNSFGPGTPQEIGGDFGFSKSAQRYPRTVDQITSLADYKKWIDGYDTGTLYADRACGRILNALADAGVLDNTVVIITSDHGENQGELGVIGDHATADHATSRVPMILRWPGMGPPRVDDALHYQTDVAATIVDLVAQDSPVRGDAGPAVPPHWDGRSFAEAFKAGRSQGRQFVVFSQCCWSCMRGVRWGDNLFIRTYHTGLKNLPARMLFDVAADPHETHDLAAEAPPLAEHGAALIERWTDQMMRTSRFADDPMWTVMREGGPWHTRAMLEKYCQRLRDTGRAHHAEFLEKNPTGIAPEA